MAGRDAELRQGEALLAEIERGPRSMLVTGPAGIGKTTVWEALTEVAADRGFRVLSARAAQSEAMLGFGGLTDLLTRVPDDALEILPPPQRSAVRAAVLRATGNGRHDRRAVAAGTLTLLRALATEAPVLVAVDDLQWIDLPTGRILDYVARRLRDERVALLASVRTDDTSMPAASLVVEGPAERSSVLTLAGLDDATIEELVSSVAEGNGHRLTMRRRRRLTNLAAGNPLFARELARTPATADRERLPATVRQLVEARIGALPQQAKDLLLLAAILREPTVPLVAMAAGTRSDEAQQSLEATADAGVLDRVDGSRRLTFSHPLYRTGIRETTSAAGQRSAHRRAASVVVDPEERAGHLALATTGPDAGLAAQLDKAADNALARGAPETATELARHALRLTPPADRNHEFARKVTIAGLEFHAGEIAVARQSLEALAQQPAPPRLRARALRVLGELESHQDGHAAAIRRFSEALALDSSPSSQGHLRPQLAYSTISDGDFEGARRHALAGLALADRIRSPARRAVVFAVAAITGFDG
jgi:hypothetical protein